MADGLACDLLVRDAGLLVTTAGEARPRGWVSITDASLPRSATRKRSLTPSIGSTLPGGLVASGLVNAHHRMFQNLTRAFGRVEARLRCGLLRSQRGVVGGKALVGNGELTLPDVDEMPKRHAEILRSWQGLHA